MEKRLNERLTNAIIEEFADLIDFGHTKTESYNIVAEHWDVSPKTVQRAVSSTLNETLSKNPETLSKTNKTLSKNPETLSKTNKTLSKNPFISADIVQHICKLGKSDDYIEAFTKLQEKNKIPNEGVKLSDGSTLLF